MKRYSLPIILASALLVQVASAQTSSSTPVIGYYKFDVKAGTSVWVSGFVAKKDFRGAATSMTAGTPNSVINQTGATWTPGAFNSHFVEILSGAQAGLILDIVSNTASSVTVEGNTTALLLTGTETYAIRQHATFGTLFAAGAGLSAFDDVIALENSDGSQTVAYFDGTDWVDAITAANANGVVVYPGQGITILAAANRVVTFGGGAVSYVKTGPTKIPVYTTAVNYIGVINPLVNTTSPAAIDSTTTLGYAMTTQLSPFDDVLATFTRDGLFDNPHVYYTDGTDVTDAITAANGNTDTIFNGSAVQVIPATDKLYTLPQSFVSAP
jgi:hypothetical protein